LFKKQEEKRDGSIIGAPVKMISWKRLKVSEEKVHDVQVMERATY
jgi:hypothetical protein